jgi:AcrR family transcriptional regulator
MPPKPGRSRARGPALTEEKILRCAIRLADEKGIEAVSMRAIAGKLGVEAMALYNHVGGKDEILGGIVEIVVSEIDVPVGGSDWRACMRRRAISAHEVLLRHPWAAALIESNTGTGRSRLKYADSVLGVLRKAGFSIELAYDAFLTLDSYIYGFALQEVNWPYPSNEVPAAIARLQAQIPATEYPHVTEVMGFVTRKRLESPNGYEREFAFGLELILDGLERTLAASKKGD